MNNSKKQLLQAFKDSGFDPRQPGPLSTVVEGTSNEYLIERAQEFLREAKQFQGSERRAKVSFAVSILAYSMTLLPVDNGSAQV